MMYLFMILLFLSAAFLILLVLIQKGKGGGLAGAFGGLGGQSAFGTKAGDTFTKITIGVAAAWILLCILSVKMLASKESRMQLGGPNNGVIPTTSGQSPTSGESSTPAQPSTSGQSSTPAPSSAPAGTSGKAAAGATAPSSGGGSPTQKPDGG